RRARAASASPVRTILLESRCMGCLLGQKILQWLERPSLNILLLEFGYFTACQLLPASSVVHFRSSSEVTVALEALFASTVIKSSDVGDGICRQFLTSSVRKT